MEEIENRVESMFDWILFAKTLLKRDFGCLKKQWLVVEISYEDLDWTATERIIRPAFANNPKSIIVVIFIE